MPTQSRTPSSSRSDKRTLEEKLADVEKKNQAHLAKLKGVSTVRKAATPTDDDILKSLQLAKKHAVSPSVKQTLARLIEVTKKGQERKAKFASKSKNDTSIFDRIKRFFQGPKVHPQKGGARKA